MNKPVLITSNTSGSCLTDDDLYRYLTREREEGAATHEEHLARCSRCRNELAELLRMLYPETESRQESEPSGVEIAEMLESVRKPAATPVSLRTRLTAWRWPLAAAAGVVLATLAGFELYSFMQSRRAAGYYALASAQLERVYAAETGQGLRLDLPFEGVQRNRATVDEEALESAENLFYQALALRDGMVEAHLGLGSVYLSQHKFPKARGQFQAVLDRSAGDPHALLGRGVALYEEAMATSDLVERRNRIQAALADFSRVLEQNPASKEARYNKILALLSGGDHKTAITEIEKYLAQDPDSPWAERLRNLRMTIHLSRTENVDEDVLRAARERDDGALQKMASLVPYQMPRAMRNALKQGLQLEAMPAGAQRQESAALYHAAGILEEKYRAATGDQSYRKLADFYGGLSPPQKLQKTVLDRELRFLIELHKQGNLLAAFTRSAPLLEKFESIGDHWQLVDLHQLRGNCLYYQADVAGALAEYRKMLTRAERAGAPDLTARALGAISTTALDMKRFDEAIAAAEQMKRIAGNHRLDDWRAFALHYLGSVYLNLNQLDRSLSEYARALELATVLGIEQVMVRALANVGSILEKKGRLEDAGAFYALAAERQAVFLRQGSSQAASALKSLQVGLDYRLGTLGLKTGEQQAARRHFEQGLAASLGEMQELEARNRLGLARLHLERGELDKAEDQLRICRALPLPKYFPEVDWEVRCLEGIVYERRGETESARAAFDHSISILEKMRSSISQSELKRAFFDFRFSPYEEMVALLFRSENGKSLAHGYVERAKSMTLRDHLKLKGSGSPSGPLLGGVVALEYFLAPDRLFAFVTQGNKVDAYSIAASRPAIEKEIQSFLESIQSGDRDLFERLSGRLHRLLVEPVMDKVASYQPETLLILPDGPLHRLPFAGLRDSRGSYLIERWPLVYAPTRSVFDHCLSLNRGSIDPRQASLLLLDGTANLPGARQEVARLARMYEGRSRMIGPGELARLTVAAADADIIHFSGHSVLSAEEPRLVFSGPHGESYLDPAAMGALRLRKARIVSLAGCSTAAGPVSSGELPWGLLPGLLGAGAPAVLASLLPVDDQVTGTLTMGFYDSLNLRKTSKAAALRNAQLSLLKDGATRTGPGVFSWTAFVLFGDPR